MKIIETNPDILNQQFITHGFRTIAADYYLNAENAASLHDLKKIFDIELQEDGMPTRKRAYLKLFWNKKNNSVILPANQSYFQTSLSNQTDGGKVRQFKILSKHVLEIPVINNIVAKNLQMLRFFTPLQAESMLTIGMHFIRYQASENGASYSSPDWLHKDDEPLVFIHLVNLSKSALGGDNLIADANSKKITHVVRLENEIDTLVLNKNVYHAVTPLGSKKGISSRDVILFTVEPQYTQSQSMMEKIA